MNASSLSRLRHTRRKLRVESRTLKWSNREIANICQRKMNNECRLGVHVDIVLENWLGILHGRSLENYSVPLTEPAKPLISLLFVFYQ